MNQRNKVDQARVAIFREYGKEEGDAFVELLKDKTFSATRLARQVNKELVWIDPLTESSIRRWRKSHGIK